MLRSVLNIGFLPPAWACNDQWPPHANSYLHPYGYLHCKQCYWVFFMPDFFNGDFVGFTVKEIPLTAVVRLWFYQPITRSDNLVYTTANGIFDHA